MKRWVCRGGRPPQRGAGCVCSGSCSLVPVHRRVQEKVKEAWLYVLTGRSDGNCVRKKVDAVVSISSLLFPVLCQGDKGGLKVSLWLC